MKQHLPEAGSVYVIGKGKTHNLVETLDRAILKSLDTIKTVNLLGYAPESRYSAKVIIGETK